jgi:hypothetical protein
MQRDVALEQARADAASPVLRYVTRSQPGVCEWDWPKKRHSKHLARGSYEKAIRKLVIVRRQLSDVFSEHRAAWSLKWELRMHGITRGTMGAR